MAQELKFAAIDTMSKEDIQALFEVICEKIFKKKPIEVKKEVLNIKGGQKEIERYAVTAHDMINIIVAHDIKFELKIEWLEGDKDQGPLPPPAVKETKTSSALGEQKDEITNPELSNSVNNGMNISEEKKVVENENTAPPPPSFLNED